MKQSRHIEQNDNNNKNNTKKKKKKKIKEHFISRAKGFSRIRSEMSKASNAVVIVSGGVAQLQSLPQCAPEKSLSPFLSPSLSPTAMTMTTTTTITNTSWIRALFSGPLRSPNREFGRGLKPDAKKLTTTTAAAAAAQLRPTATINIKVVILVVVVVVLSSLLKLEGAHNLQLKSNLSSSSSVSSSVSSRQQLQPQFKLPSSLVAITRLTKTNFSSNYENHNQTTKSPPLVALNLCAARASSSSSSCASSYKSSNLQIEKQLPTLQNQVVVEKNDEEAQNENIRKTLEAETTTTTTTATHQLFNSTTATTNIYSNQKKQKQKQQRKHIWNILFATKQQTTTFDNNYDGLSLCNQKLDKQQNKTSENGTFSNEQQRRRRPWRHFNSSVVVESDQITQPVPKVDNQSSTSPLAIPKRILRTRSALPATDDDDFSINSLNLRPKVILPVVTEKQNEELIELLAQFYAYTKLINDRLSIERLIRQHQQQSIQKSENNSNRTVQQFELANNKFSESNKNKEEKGKEKLEEEDEEIKMKVNFSADEESLLNWLRQKQENYPSLKNATFELLQEYPNRTIIVCEDGPKILVLPDRRDIVYCYTSEQWMKKLWLDIENSLTLIHYPIIILNILIFLFGTTGNIFVCLSVYRNHQLRNVTNYFIVNLAFADFLVILICLPATVIWDLSLTWFFGTISCKMIMFLQDVSISVSVLTLTAISIDRYYAICYPLRFKSNLSQAKRIIVLIWIVSFLIMAPNLIYLRAKTSEELSEAGLDTVLYSDCNYDWSHESSRVFQFVKTILLYLLPFILMFVAHFKILQALKAASAICYTAARLSYSQQQQQQHQQQLMMPNDDLGSQNRNSTRHVHYSHSQLKLHPSHPSHHHHHQHQLQHEHQQQQQQPRLHSSQQIDVVSTSSFLAPRQKLDATSSSPSPSSSHHLRSIQAINELKAAVSTKDRDVDDFRPRMGDGDDDADDALTGGAISAPVASFVTINSGQRRRSSSFREQRRDIPAAATSEMHKADGGCNTLSLSATSGNGNVDGNDIKVSRISLDGSQLATGCTTTVSSVGVSVGAGVGQGSANVMKESRGCITIDREQRRVPRSSHHGLCSIATQLLNFPHRLRICLGAATTRSTKPSSSFPSLGGGGGAAQIHSNALATDTNELLQKLAEGRIVMENGNVNTILNGCVVAAATSTTSTAKNNNNSSSYRCCPLKVEAHRPNNNNNNNTSNNNNNNNNSGRVVIRETSLISLQNPKQQQQVATKRNQAWHSNQSSTTRTVDEQRQLIVTMHNKSKLESRKAAAKMLMTIVILFGICYLPVHLINFLRQFIENIPQTELTSTISMLAHCICYLNSAINPIIYNHMNSVFRAEFKKFLSCLCWLPNNSPNQQHQTNHNKADRSASVRRFAGFNGTNSTFLTTKVNAANSPTFAGQAAATTFVDLDMASESSPRAAGSPLVTADLKQELEEEEEQDDQVQIQELDLELELELELEKDMNKDEDEYEDDKSLPIHRSTKQVTLAFSKTENNNDNMTVPVAAHSDVDEPSSREKEKNELCP